MGMKQFWKECLAGLLLVLVVCVEVAYREPLYDYSLELIREWQKGESEAKNNFFSFISFFGTSNTIAILLVLIYSFSSRRLFMKMLLIFYVTQNLLAFFKVFYHNPRPYFSSDDILAINCSKGYGNPSGHCIFVIVFYGTLWTLLFVNNSEPGDPLFSEKWQKAAVQWMTFTLITGVIILTFFARLYLGVHSLNQTIYGFTLGFWALYTLSIVAPKYVEEHFDNSVQNGTALSKNRGAVLIIIIFIALQGLNVILYLGFRNKEEFMRSEWVDRINAKCPNALSKATPFEDSFKSVLHASLYVFVYFAQLFSARTFPNVFNYWYSNIGFLKVALRTVIIVTVLGACFIPYFLTKNASFVVRMCVGIVVTNILIAGLGIFAIDWIVFKLELVAVPKTAQGVKAV